MVKVECPRPYFDDDIEDGDNFEVNAAGCLIIRNDVLDVVAAYAPGMWERAVVIED